MQTIVTLGLGKDSKLVTLGYGRSIARIVLREVLRLYSRISKILRLDSKWKKTYSS